jgi:predicted nucleic-acid-binding protein
MIALDTNVLVRFLVEDDRKQAVRARSLFKKAAASETPLYVCDIVFCEVVWVLDSAYGFEREEIAAVLSGLLQTRNLRFRSADQIGLALEAYRTGPGDFADYLIREQAHEAGCELVVTFDRALLNQAGFRKS